MLSNLITSLLIATAVGGTTATAFDKEPSKAIEITQQNINNSENTTEIEIVVDDVGVNKAITNNENREYTSMNQYLSNNTLLTMQASVYINNYKTYNPQTGSSTTTIGEIYTFYRIDTFQQYNLAGNEVDQWVKIIATSSDNENIRLRCYWSYCFYNTGNGQTYNDLLGKTIQSDTDWTSLQSRYTELYNSTSEKDANVMDWQGMGQQAEREFQNPYEAMIISPTNHMLIATKQTYMLYGTYPHPTSSYITYEHFSQRMILEYNVGASTLEVIDIPGLMYTVITMPFSFISQAFNLTVFAGTPYAINFANIIQVILVVLLVLFIVRIIMGFIK